MCVWKCVRELWVKRWKGWLFPFVLPTGVEKEEVCPHFCKSDSHSCPAAALKYRRLNTHTSTGKPTCFSVTIDNRFDAWERGGDNGEEGGVRLQGYTAQGTHGCQEHFDLRYAPTCRVPVSGGGTISPPSPLSHTKLPSDWAPPHTRRLCPSSGADPRGQVNQRPGLWKHGRSHGRSALIIRVGTRRGVSSQSTQTLYVHQHEQGFLHVFQLAVWHCGTCFYFLPCCESDEQTHTTLAKYCY